MTAFIVEGKSVRVFDYSKLRDTLYTSPKDCIYPSVEYCYYDCFSDLDVLKKFPNLKKVKCSYNSVWDLRPIIGIKSLEVLLLYNNRISDLSPLKELTNLEILDVSNNNITDLSPLSKLKNLKKLFLSGNKINDLSPLKELTNLEILDVSNNNITDFKSIYDLPNLKDVHFICNNLLNLKDLKPLQNKKIKTKKSRKTDISGDYIHGTFSLFFDENKFYHKYIENGAKWIDYDICDIYLKSDEYKDFTYRFDREILWVNFFEFIYDYVGKDDNGEFILYYSPNIEPYKVSFKDFKNEVMLWQYETRNRGRSGYIRYRKRGDENGFGTTKNKKEVY